MRVRFFNSLFFRLGLAIFCLLAGISIAQQYLASQAFRSALIEAEERQALIVAHELSAELREHLTPEIKERSLLALLLQFGGRHPDLIPFIVEENGTIFLSGINGIKAQPFTVAHLSQYLSPSLQLPVFTNDPKAPGHETPFVAVEINLAQRRGYLVLLLNQANTQSRPSGAALIASTTHGFLLSLIFALVASLLIASVVLRTLTRRMRRLSHAIGAYQLGDDLPDVVGKDEVAALSRSFHNMASTIKHQVELLKERDALRRELVAGVSHDLRTPLASIRGYLQKLLEQINAGTLTDERLRDFLQTIQRNAVRLEALVASLFELARIEALGTNLNRTPFAVNSLLTDLISRFEPIAKERGVTIAFVAPATDVILEGDRSLIDRAVANLIDNAIRYSNKSDEVTIGLVDAPDGVTISVSDRGSGIPPHEHARIFEKFYRGDSARQEGGMGLGLAITKGIVEAHAGEISLQSRAGGGSCFTIRLAPAKR